jgi:hypothetical protein
MKSALCTSRRVVSTCAAVLLLGCGTSTDGIGTGTGGQSLGSGGSASGSGGANPSGGSVSSGGSVGTGGLVGTGGSSAVGSGGASGTGGRSGSGGMTGTGGSANSGGALSTGGATATGGRLGTGGGSGAAGATDPGGGTGGRGTGGQTETGGRATGGTTGGGTGGRATGGSTGTGGTTGAGGSTGACPHVQMKGSDFCTIGDSWIQIPGNQVTTLENHLVAAGVIPSGEHFDRREVSGTPIDTIVASYTKKPNNCKVLIMDGGGIDLFSTPLGPDSSAVTAVVTKFKNFLAQVKTLGFTEHIIYSLYPVIPSTKNLNANMKPGYSAACAASAVDCHLVDLEPLFKGQHFGSDSTHADNAGGVIIGDAWWKAMQENCIAQ